MIITDNWGTRRKLCPAVKLPTHSFYEVWLLNNETETKLLYLHVIPFKAIPIQSYTPQYMNLPGLETSSEVIFWQSVSNSAAFLWMSSVDWKWVPLSELLDFGGIKTSHGVRFGEYGACSSVGICFVAKTWRTDSLGPLWHTMFQFSNSLLKFVSPFLCPYSTPPVSFSDA
jgi:hypothetical protein